MRFRPAALALLAASVLVGCGSARARPPVVIDDSGLAPTSTTYVVTAITVAGKPHALVPRSELRLTFRADQLTITAGCNTMSGTFDTDGSQLTLRGLASTEMGCSQPLMDQDTWVARLFDKPVRLTTGADASLVSGYTVLSLADRRTVHPDKSLVGTTWVLDSVGANGLDGAVSSVPAGIIATVKFRTDGKVQVSDGLNDGFGPVSVVGDQLRFGEFGWTTVGCTDGSCSVREVGDVFAGTATFVIEENRLTITNGEDRLGFHAR